ncbi:MAG: GDP-mannose 4,6-dehydratase [Proteobacteria bacterium]|nr:GDP-mannose 4,6-dehydratase [Pseudomonadota bacterium]
MRILITGAAGLYGVHLVDELVKMEAVSRVIGVDNFSRQYCEKNPFIPSPELKAKFELIQKDFVRLTPDELEGLELDAVIHLAAYISIPESMERQEDYFWNNEYGTFKLIQSLVKSKRWPLFIYASSPEVYGNPIYTPMDVNHPLLPRSIYAVTKLAAEKHCYAMYEWYRYPVVIIRNFNTYGENQDIGGNAGVVSSFLVRALKGEPLVVHNEGRQTRDFQYVKDAVHAYCLVLMKGAELAGKVFNIGTGKQTSVIDLAKMILKITASRSPVLYEEGRSADLMSLEADYSDINASTGWMPRYTLEDGLKQTADWYKRFIR